MSLLPTTLSFGETTLAIIDRHGEPWLSARELARALGYQDESAVLRIYSRNADEFTNDMTLTVKLTVNAGPVSYTQLTLPTTNKPCRSRW